MKAVALVTMNRVNSIEGEYARVSQGGNDWEENKSMIYLDGWIKRYGGKRNEGYKN